MELLYTHSTLTAKEFAQQTIGRLNATFGVDLSTVFNDNSLDTAAKARHARVLLLQRILDDLERNAAPEEMATPEAFDEDMHLRQMLSSDVEIEPNYSLTETDAKIVMKYEGRGLNDYVFSLTKRLENMANAKTAGQLAIELVAGGLISVGVPMAIGAVKALKAGMTILNAVRAGVTSIGLKTAIGVVVVILVGFLLYLLLDNPKKILGIIVNDTVDNFVVNDWRKGVDGKKEGDLFMQHGFMANFPQDNEGGLDKPIVQIRGKVDFGEGDEDNVCFAGIYFADRNIGFRGAEGVMIFTSKDSALKFAVQFAVPYTNDNGANIQLVTGAVDIEKLYRDMYNGRGVKVEKTEGGYRLRAAVNDARGGVVSSISSISKVAA